jgi:hypothetical protein
MILVVYDSGPIRRMHELLEQMKPNGGGDGAVACSCRKRSRSAGTTTRSMKARSSGLPELPVTF